MGTLHNNYLQKGVEFMKKIRFLSLFLVLSMMISLFVGCNSSDNKTTDGSTATDQGSSKSEGDTDSTNTSGGKVRILTNVTGGKDETEMKQFTESLAKATGLEVEIERPPSDYTQVMMQKLLGGEKYDLIYMNINDYANLIDQGALLDITDRVQGSEILSGNIDQREWDDITFDGKIYGGFNKKELHRVVALNKIHLENAGIDYKTIEPTLDGYYDVFTKLREANDSNDYYPLNGVISETYDIQPWMSSLGLMRGVVTDEADGKTYAPYATDESKPVWEWLKKLYDEKLLDPGSFVDKTKDMRDKMGAASEKSSVTVDWAMWVGLHNAGAASGDISTDQYEIVSLPGTKTPDGDYLLVKGGASLFGVPANSENPDNAVKVLEYFATQEGGELLSLGIEEVDYTKDGDKYEYTELGLQHGGDHGAPVPIFKDFKHPIGYNLGVEEALTFVDYSVAETPIPNEGDFKITVGKWGVQMIKGDVSIDEGLEGLRKELVALSITEK